MKNNYSKTKIISYDKLYKKTILFWIKRFKIKNSITSFINWICVCKIKNKY